MSYAINMIFFFILLPFVNGTGEMQQRAVEEVKCMDLFWHGTLRCVKGKFRMEVKEMRM